jgi:Domain of unknown function (DUF305)
MLRFLKPDLGKAIFAASILLGVAAASFAHDTPSPGDEAAFLKENDAAMNRMMGAMTAKPTGDVDRDFVAVMTPHHQGAIDMAVIELRYGKNETLRRIAQEIIVDQMQEIDAMKLAIGEKVTASAPAPTQPTSAPADDRHHMDLNMDMPTGMKN